MKSLAVTLGLCVLCCTSAWADDGELKSVKARTLELQVPNAWVQQKPENRMRAAQFSIPGDKQDAQLVVSYFGGPTGGVKANVERWIGQFQKDGLKVEMREGKCAAGSYIVVDCQGTWNKPDGPPFARRTVAAPNSRVMNVIVVEEKDGEKDYYFLKLSGNQAVVAKQAKALRTAIWAKADSEKEFKLE
jgi:hypothetical protein